MHTISFKIFWDLLLFYQIFLSPKVKQCPIIFYKHGTCELPNELLNDLRFRILGKQELWWQILNFIELQPSAQSFYQNESFVNTRRNLLKKKKLTFSRCVLFHMKTRVSLKSIFESLSVENFFLIQTCQRPLQTSFLWHFSNCKAFGTVLA